MTTTEVGYQLMRRDLYSDNSPANLGSSRVVTCFVAVQAPSCLGCAGRLARDPYKRPDTAEQYIRAVSPPPHYLKHRDPNRLIFTDRPRVGDRRFAPCAMGLKSCSRENEGKEA